MSISVQTSIALMELAIKDATGSKRITKEQAHEARLEMNRLYYLAIGVKQL
jgi:hypothetical protein